MNQQQKDAWLAALRSGEYPQGKGYLQQGEGFCCLGVYAKVHAPEWLDRHKGAGTLSRNIDPLPVEQPCEHARQMELARMNDEGMMTFAEIAKWIENNIEATP